MSFDYIVAGGGLCGCTLASRLSETSTVLLIEAGKDVKDHPLTQTPLACMGAHGSEIDWNHKTTPQAGLRGRECYLAAGKALSGGTAINYGTWTRGPAFDYDVWAELVGDQTWSYASMLPYFKRVEHYHGELDGAPGSMDGAHGSTGRIHNVSVQTSSADRIYPLSEPVFDAWRELGVKKVADGNAGYPIGLGDYVENFYQGKRQLASEAYSLKNVVVVTDVIVKRVLFHGKRASGVELVDGRTFRAEKEVIVAAGAYKTPQVLMLSGVGPKAELERHQIPLVADNEDVGRHLHDHLAYPQWWVYTSAQSQSGK